MKNRIGQMNPLAVLAIIALAAGVVLVGTGQFSVGDLPGQDTGDEADVPAEIRGETADVDIKASDAADSASPDVAVPGDLYAAMNGEERVNSATTNSDGSRVSVSGLTVGEEFAVYYGVDNSTYYGDRDPETGSTLIDARTKRSSGEVYSVVGSGSASVSIYDSDDSDVSGGSVTVGSGETYPFEKLRARADAEDTSWNVEYVYVNDTQLSGVDEWRLDGASEIEVPDHLSDDYSHAFELGEAGDLTQGEEPTLLEFDRIEPGQLALDMESGQDPSGDVDVCVDDAAMFTDDSDAVQQGSEDDDDNDVGLGEQCVTVTIG